MKNIHIIPTDKPSRLISSGKEFNLLENPTLDKRCKHIYITSDEVIKEGQNYIGDGLSGKNKFKWTESQVKLYPNVKKEIIILTTDQDLIKDGVQAIDDEFLEWFVKNPSCEFAHLGFTSIIGDLETKRTYKIIIPKEEPKQETIEEAAERYSSNVLSKLGFLNGVKWQQERSYSEEEIYNLIQAGYSFCEKGKNREDVKKWFEQFKKK